LNELVKVLNKTGEDVENILSNSNRSSKNENNDGDKIEGEITYDKEIEVK
jgi:arsenate reductase-like glutaredoxin family protein